MPRHIEVRIRVPVGKLGELVDEVLPYWAETVGFDRMPDIDEDDEAPKKKKVKAKPNGKGTGTGNPPVAGSVGDAVLKRIRSAPGKTRGEIFSTLAKHKESALSSSLYDLARRGFIKKNGNGLTATWDPIRHG